MGQESLVSDEGKYLRMLTVEANECDEFRYEPQMIFKMNRIMRINPTDNSIKIHFDKIFFIVEIYFFFRPNPAFACLPLQNQLLKINIY
jgi:hypothetical protein